MPSTRSCFGQDCLPKKNGRGELVPHICAPSQCKYDQGSFIFLHQRRCFYDHVEDNDLHSFPSFKAGESDRNQSVIQSAQKDLDGWLSERVGDLLSSIKRANDHDSVSSANEQP